MPVITALLTAPVHSLAGLHPSDLRHRSLRNTINLLLKCRQRNGISGRSKLEILAAEADMYVARIDDKVRCALGPCRGAGLSAVRRGLDCGGLGCRDASGTGCLHLLGSAPGVHMQR